MMNLQIPIANKNKKKTKVNRTKESGPLRYCHCCSERILRSSSSFLHFPMTEPRQTCNYVSKATQMPYYTSFALFPPLYCFCLTLTLKLCICALCIAKKNCGLYNHET